MQTTECTKESYSTNAPSLFPSSWVRRNQLGMLIENSVLCAAALFVRANEG